MCCRRWPRPNASSRIHLRICCARCCESWPLHEQRAFFEDDLGIPLALEEESGKLFPRSESRPRRARRAGDVRGRAKEWTCGSAPRSPTCRARRSGFAVETSGGTHRMRSRGAGNRRAVGAGDRQRRHRASHRASARTRPRRYVSGAHAAARRRRSSCVAVGRLVECARCARRTARKSIETHGGFLFTHRGYSGPSVLDISHVTRPAARSPAIRVQWAALEGRRADGRSGDSVAVILSRHIPASLAEQLMTECGVPFDRRTSSLKRAERVALDRGADLLSAALERQRRLQESGGHRRRHQARRRRSQNTREPQGRGAVSLWRDARRVRPHRRPQLLLGVVHRPRRRSRRRRTAGRRHC